MALSLAQRRLSLDQLGRDHPQAIASHFGLEIKDRRSKEEHVEAILRAQRLEWRHPLGLLKRNELQAICDALASTAAGEGRC